MQNIKAHTGYVCHLIWIAKCSRLSLKCLRAYPTYVWVGRTNSRTCGFTPPLEIGLLHRMQHQTVLSRLNPPLPAIYLQSIVGSSSGAPLKNLYLYPHALLVLSVKWPAHCHLNFVVGLGSPTLFFIVC